MKRSFLKLSLAMSTLFIVSLAGSLFVEWNIRRNTPTQLQAAILSAKSSKGIQNKIGELISEQYSFKNQNNADSINYSFSLIGDKATMQIQNYEANNKNKWNIYKSDTTLLAN